MRNLEFKDMKDYDPRNPLHFLIDRKSPILKNRLELISIRDINKLDHFVKQFTNKDLLKKVVKQLEINPHLKLDHGILQLSKKVREQLPVYMAIKNIPHDKIIFCEDKSKIHTLNKIYVLLNHSREIIKAFSSMEHISSALKKAEELQEMAIENEKRAKAIKKMHGAASIDYQEKLLKQSKQLNNQANDIENSIFQKLNLTTLEKNSNNILDIGNKFYKWKISAASMKTILLKAIDSNQAIINKFEIFENRLLHSGESIESLKRIYGREAILNPRIIFEMSQRLQNQIKGFERDIKTIESSAQLKIKQYIEIARSKSSIIAHFDKGIYGFDSEGYDSYILGLYKKFFNPSAVLKHNPDGTVQFVNWKNPTDSLGKIKIPFEHLEEIESHVKYLENTIGRYSDILDFRDYQTRKIFRNVKAGEDYNDSMASWKSWYNNQPIQNRERERETRDIAIDIERRGYAGPRDIRGYRISIFDPVFKGFVGYDTRAKYHPRFKPTASTALNFGRGRDSNHNLDIYTNSLERQMNFLSKRDPISDKIITDKSGNEFLLPADVQHQRRYEYIRGKLFRPDLVQNSLEEISNIKYPWMTFMKLHEEIDNANHPDQIAPIVGKIFHNFHRSGTEFRNQLEDLKKNNPGLINMYINQMGYEAQFLLQKARNKAWLLNDPSLQQGEAPDMNWEVDSLNNSVVWGSELLGRLENGYRQFERAHDQFEEHGAGRIKKNPHLMTDTFYNDERFASRGTGIPKMRILSIDIEKEGSEGTIGNDTLDKLAFDQWRSQIRNKK